MRPVRHARACLLVASLGLPGVLVARAEGPPDVAPPADDAGVPARAQESTDVPAEAVVADVPFEPYPERNRVVVDLSPDANRPFPLMLDTGASHSVLTPLVARRLGVSVRRQKADPYLRATKLGRDLAFYIDTSSSDTGSRTGFEVGLLGGNFLQHYVVELDFDARRVRFLDPARYQVPEAAEAAGALVLPLQWNAVRPVATLGVNGTPVALLLDTGAPDAFVLAGPVAETAAVAPISDAPVRIGLVLGPTDGRIAEIERLDVGGLQLDAVPALVAPRGLYNLGSASDSLAGYDFLSLFRVRIDYPRGRLWLRPRSDALPTLGGVDWRAQRQTGALVSPRQDHLLVWAVLPGSVAARRGVQAGDRIRWKGSETDEASGARTLLDDLSADRDVKLWRGADAEAVEIVLPPSSPAGTGAETEPPAR